MRGDVPTLPIIASLGLCLGLALLYLRWRQRTGRGLLARYGVAAGWAIIAAGLMIWTAVRPSDVNMCIGLSLFPCLALAIVVLNGLKLPVPSRPSRNPGAEREVNPAPPRHYGHNGWSRMIARLLGSVVLSPAFGLMAGLFWRAIVPGNDADRLIGLAFVTVIAMALAWVAQLVTRHAWRVCAVLALTSGGMAIFMYAPRFLPS